MYLILSGRARVNPQARLNEAPLVLRPGYPKSMASGVKDLLGQTEMLTQLVAA
ncbi:MAG: hypothetical protein RIT28_3518, partial [Pseudomonadota bacterium]